jgi:uncharacterized membrane protein YdcZ (DUF606 family)
MSVILEQKNSTKVEDRMQQRLYFLFPGMGGGKAILASAWIDQRLGVVVIFVHSSHPASKGKTT